MCGITGFLSFLEPSGSLSLAEVVREMADTLTHRGPDSQGIWVDTDVGIALGHRRLAIVDLSPEGHQPMLCSQGRYVLSFNGEIYNFQDLRRQLETLNYPFRGCSDTEVMLAAFCEWGVEAAVKKFIGMFAFALWDRQEQVLHLGRDRFGEKPLYYGWMGNTFLFGSELKALRVHPHWQGNVDRNALTLLLRHGYIPGAHSIYKDIHKLLPGTLLRLQTAQHNPQSELITYWSMRSVMEMGYIDPFVGSDQEAVSRLDYLLRDSIRQQMIADVPLGAFLSGGIDSSTIVALMQAQSNQPVKTFTIGFHEDDYNEASYAKAIANHLGADHTEFYISPEEALKIIPQLPTIYDEPFSDPSQIPTFLVSQLARQHVTVSLSGDAGDELFGGYDRYLCAIRIWQLTSRLPRAIRKVLASTLTYYSPESWNKVINILGFISSDFLKSSLSGDRIHKLAAILPTNSPETLYAYLMSYWQSPTEVVIGASEPVTTLMHQSEWPHTSDFIQSMMYLDAITYLPDDILTKVDRAAMAVSLETRIPLLDHRIVEFAGSLPMNFKIRRNQGKWLLRQVLYQYVPQSLVDRPKKGFGVPLNRWLRSEFRDWAEDLLNERRLHQEGFLNPEPIRQKWQEHLSGEHNWQYHLWNIITFQMWLSENK